jgi:hypothetical protein
MSEPLSECELAAGTRPSRPGPRELLVLATLVGIALYVRLFGLTWDHGYLFHPDERQVVFVTSDLHLGWPLNWSELLSPQSSWNPGFFSYGSLPLYLLRILAAGAAEVWPAMENLREFYVIGRVLSALADVGTILLIYALGRRLYGNRVALLAAAFLTGAVLHVQLSHYYAVDTLLTFAVMLVLYLCVRLVEQPTLVRCLGLGAAIGMACAIKISALALMAPFAVAWVGSQVLSSHREGQQSQFRKRHPAGEALRGWVLAGWALLLTFILLEPYAVIDLETFLGDVATESMMVRGTLDLPYTRQYAGTIPYLYQIAQTVRWSLGPLLGVAGFTGVVYALIRLWRHGRGRRWSFLLAEAIPIAWFVVYFGITGSFHAKFSRYMLPVTPLLCLWAAAMLTGLIRQPQMLWRVVGSALAAATLAGSALYTAAFLNIYASTHPWEQATEWICEQVPEKSVLMIEHWDQPLPILQGIGAHDCWSDYRIVEFPAYDADSPGKLAELVNSLRAADYVLLSSNRLYGSITRLPRRYPMTSQYYRRLFAEELGFQLVHFDQVYPQLGSVRLVDDTLTAPGLDKPDLLRAEGRWPSDLVMGYADESYSVYDHPMPLVFQNVSHLSADQLIHLLTTTE